ncbi:alkaline-phosphatase-like protein [Leucosporidium creatinivorum]|uniref:Alkaline-phosphatase-like protein n=1 Tax=Leucosporidium creatinivorum TaxID=106004 RepID=A0A1Y2FKN1_9BASI|nr:alkaline-phosphatase-like protein [Leucosporidium creatinivorum]
MPSAMASQQPNIVFIMADDHASKAISAYGAHGAGAINRTPNLDRIATGGMLFNHCYVTNSICTPSRATILCGTHNHVNGVHTLDGKIDRNLPNVAKHLRSSAGYQTAMLGKWHLGEGKAHEPTGFDEWDILPGQGQYFDPSFINSDGTHVEKGYVTDIITDKAIDFIEKRDPTRPFFTMVHHKAPHRSWECDPKHKHLYKDPIKLPETFTDDYKNRAKAASVAKMRVESDMSYQDLGLVQPEGGSEVGELEIPGLWYLSSRKVPMPDDVSQMRLVDKDTAEVFTFKTRAELSTFKYQRYMQRYLRCIQSIDDNVGRLLDYLEQAGLTENTMVIYTSDQGFFLGEHGWFDKRFIYEESFQMPFLIKWPEVIKPGSVCNDIISNVDFAATWLEAAGVRIPSYMQGESFLSSLQGVPRAPDDTTVAYHRYWMHRDMIHDAYAHYGIRNHKYKLIYWYNEGFDLPGTGKGGQEREWELFDCDEDPLELFNVWCSTDPKYLEAREQMVRALNVKMEEIGDTPVHDPSASAAELAKRDAAFEGSNIAAKANEKNM